MRSIKFQTLVLCVFASYIIVTKQKFLSMFIEMKSLPAFKILSVFFALFFLSVNGESRVSLTTATECDSECLKPTPLYRRVDMNPSEEVGHSTAMNFIRARERRETPEKSDSKIWNWDYLCLLQAKTGKCRANIQKFYYDLNLDKCVNFTYGGCEGNDNNFDTITECERKCKGAALMSDTTVVNEAICSLQRSSGLCLGFINMYYYNVNTKTCENLIYGGCGGNDNRFETKYKCLKKCGKKSRA